MSVTSTMSREAAQEFSRWKSSEVMGWVYSKVRSESVVPGMRTAAARAGDHADMEFLKDLESALTLAGVRGPPPYYGVEAMVAMSVDSLAGFWCGYRKKAEDS